MCHPPWGLDVLQVRHVELDCWDGVIGGKKMPIITHGHTICTQVSFESVAAAIGEYAFRSSELPVDALPITCTAPLLSRPLSRDPKRFPAPSPGHSLARDALQA